MSSRKRIGALVLLAAGGIIYWAGSSGSASSEISSEKRALAERPPLAVSTSAAVASEPIVSGAECLGSEAHEGSSPLDSPSSAPKVAGSFAPAPTMAAAHEPIRNSEPVRNAEPNRVAEPRLAEPRVAEPRRDPERRGVGPVFQAPGVGPNETTRAAFVPEPRRKAPSQDLAPPVDPEKAEVVPEAPVQKPLLQSPMVIGRFQSKVGSSYTLERVVCALDGVRVYSGPSAGAVELFRRGTSPGVHTVSIIAEYRGQSSGVFSYTNGYRFSLQGAQRFTVKPGQPASLSVTAFERGGPTVPIEKRLALAISAH